jgi:N-acetylmuramoyl-L-alanine amidase
VKRIVVQAGHMKPLQPGFEDDTGAKGEAELVADIQRALVRLLSRDDNFHGIPMPGRIDDSVQCDAAIFLHADGFTDPSANGFAVGFPAFDVNRRLAHMIAEEIEKLPGHPRRRPDNGTTDMAKYYGFRHIDTPGPEVIVEHGFVTNPREHQWLKDHVEEIAQAQLNALRRFFGFTGAAAAETPHPAEAHGPVTVDSALLAVARAPAPQAVRFLLSRAHGEYTDGDVQTIVGHYYATAPTVGLDPLLVVAQLTEETEHLTSFWSQRPRRNPAGIGVTGKPGVGLSFPDWKTAARAHTGRLLAYVLPKDTGNAAQVSLVKEALAFRSLPDNRRGVAPTLKGLSGKWAADPQYAVKLASVANQILGHDL